KAKGKSLFPIFRLPLNISHLSFIISHLSFIIYSYMNRIFIRSLATVFVFVSLVAGGLPGAFAAAREPVRGRSAMVASQHKLASEIGVAIMKRGGNAVDAAIAVGIALAVVYPEAGNLGGGGFMVIRKKDGSTHAIDYREMAPAAAHRDLYIDENGELIRGEGGSTIGYRADRNS